MRQVRSFRREVLSTTADFGDRDRKPTFNVADEDNAAEDLQDLQRIRNRFTALFSGAASLYKAGKISREARGRLKERILSNDEGCAAAYEVFSFDNDEEELLDTLQRLSVR